VEFRSQTKLEMTIHGGCGFLNAPHLYTTGRKILPHIVTIKCNEERVISNHISELIQIS